jgi:hypothetical protein
MNAQKRKRGRPLGSGKNDELTLMQTAQLMVADTTLKPTTAMRQVMRTRKDWPETQETLLRCLQVKWRAHGEIMLARARREREPRPKVTFAEALALLASSFPHAQPPTWSPEIVKLLEAVAGFDRSIKQFLSSPQIMEAMEAFHGFTKTIQDKRASPLLRDLAKLTSTLNYIPPDAFHTPPQIGLAAKLALDNANLVRVANAALPPLPGFGHSSSR